MNFTNFWESAKESYQDVVFDASTLDFALKGYRKETMGSDIWKPSELRVLPEMIKSLLAHSIESSLKAAAIPHQHLLSLSPLLGKPNKSCRTVCKTPMLYRMPLRADFSVRHWEHHHTQEYDMAKEGCSALTAALKRNLGAEIAFWNKEHFATILNDFEKYFDTLDISVLMQQGIDTNFPLGPMAYALQQHLAPRVLQANGFSSSPVAVNRSILAGCKFSVPFTRIYGLKQFITLSKNNPKANTELFVDDTSMHAAAETKLEVQSILLKAMRDFKTLVQKLKLRLSPKAAIVASSNILACKLNNKLTAYGLKFVLAHHSRDLGITTTAGKTRPKHIQKDRQQKSRNRIFKVSQLAKISRSARKLYTGSGFSVSTWGHQACAVSQGEMHALETDALACSGIKTAGRCRTIALAVAYGVLGTPRARIIRETLRDFFTILRNISPSELLQLRTAWAEAKQELKKKSLSVASVHGILSNVIYILLHAQWNPIAYNFWEDDTGGQWQIVDWKVSPDIVSAAITKSYLDISLRKADSHHNGKGIYYGIDSANTFRHVRSIKTHTDINYQYKAAIETVMSGCCWSASRINSINPEFDKLCPRCGLCEETDYHTFWECGCNDSFTHPFVTKTNHLKQKAREGTEEYPCFWLRGIIPASFTQVPPPHTNPSEEYNYNFVNPEQQNWMSGTYYGDASGGKNTSYKQLRRVGVAVVKCNHLGETLFGVSTNLPGKVQTVGRGEVLALLLLMMNLDHDTEVEFVTDNLNVYNTCNSGIKAAINSANCDLYKDIYTLVQSKHVSLSVRWIPSHLGKSEADFRPEGVTFLDVLANDQADKYAGEAAQLHNIPDSITRPIIQNINNCIAIQKRLAFILINLPERQNSRDEKPLPQPRVKLDQLLANTTHCISTDSNRIQCSVCLNSFNINDPNCKHWLKTKCIPQMGTAIAQQQTIPLPLSESIHFGNQVSHSSHKLNCYKGIVYCARCGTRNGSNQIRYLAKQCEPPTLAGRVLLNCITNDKPPAGLTEWPANQHNTL